MKILMVCLGNICRSPLAEGILKHKIKKAGLDWVVDSAGTSGYHTGCPPHHFSQKVAKHYGLDITSQTCRNFTQNDIEIFDKIYVMDEDNYNAVKRFAGKKWNPSKVDYLMNHLYPGQNRIVPDPWFGGEEGFHKVYELINRACEKILQDMTSPQIMYSE